MANRVRLLLQVATGRCVGSDSRHIAPGGSGKGRQGSKSHGRHHRQPERETGGNRAACGFDAGKKVKGRKRHIVVDTLGLILNVVVHAANIQDRDGAVLVPRGLKALFPWLALIWADGAYGGEKLAAVMPTLGPWRLEIVKRRPETQGFEVLPKRWMVERTLGWLVRRRRLRVDYEGRPESAEALIKSPCRI